MAESTTDTNSSSSDNPPATPKKEPKINKIFRAATKNGASDIHLKAGCPPRFRLGGSIRTAATDALTGEQIEKMVFECLTAEQVEKCEKFGSIDFAHAVTHRDRFRVNAFKQRGQMSVAARRIPTEILDYDQLNLPPVLAEIAKLHQGMVLVAGITGSGKSTTIAAMIEQINQSRSCHIMTIEDPIEFLYEDKKAFVNQREIGLDVPDFHLALKYLMREDPDVVLIGEMRDEETFSAALHAAESGHLCFGTVHASNASSTIARVLELFPEEARELVRTSLVFNLQAIVCLKLLKSIRPDIPRIPAVEVLLVNSTVRKLISEHRENDIQSVIRNSYHDGMQDFNEALRKLVEEEFVSAKTAYEAAPNPDELKMRLKGIHVSGGGIIG